MFGFLLEFQETLIKKFFMNNE